MAITRLPPPSDPPRPGGRKKPYSQLTADEKWAYHADVYAWRRVWLGVQDDIHTWEGDLRGEWFDEPMVYEATLRHAARKRAMDEANRRARDKRRGKPREDPRADPVVQAQRAAWIKHRGYPSWDAYLDAVEAGREKITAFLAWCYAQNSSPNRVGTFKRAVPPAAE